MRESIGGNFLFQIAIVLILLFTGIMCVTINHSRAYAVKDEIVNIIQNNAVAYGISETGKINDKVIEEISSYMVSSGYRVTGKCPSGYQGYDRMGNNTYGSNSSICIRAVDVAESYNNQASKKCGSRCYIADDLPRMYYYDIMLFYQIDAPVIENMMNFRMKASTKILYS